MYSCLSFFSGATYKNKTRYEAWPLRDFFSSPLLKQAWLRPKEKPAYLMVNGFRS